MEPEKELKNVILMLIGFIVPGFSYFFYLFFTLNSNTFS